MQLIKFNHKFKFNYKYTTCYAIVDSINFKSLTKFSFIDNHCFICIDLNICEKYEISSPIYLYNMSDFSWDGIIYCCCNIDDLLFVLERMTKTCKEKSEFIVYKKVLYLLEMCLYK